MVAMAMNHIHLLCEKSTFSLRLERLRRKSDTIASTTPAHCHALSLSPNRSIAPTSTSMGRVAFIGPTMVMGRCFRPKYPNIHEVRTMHDLRMTRRWAFSSGYLSASPAGWSAATAPDVSGCPANGLLSRTVPANQPVPAMESSMNGEKISVEKRVLRSSTGRTALFSSAAFFDVS